MNCPKCNGQSVYPTFVSEDRSGYTWTTWFCPNCGHEHTTHSYVSKRKAAKSGRTEPPDEVVINGVKYRRV